MLYRSKHNDMKTENTSVYVHMCIHFLCVFARIVHSLIYIF